MPKTTIEAHYSCCMEKAAPKTVNIEKKKKKISKFAQNGHYLQAIAFAKCSVLIKH